MTKIGMGQCSEEYNKNRVTRNNAGVGKGGSK